MTEVEAVAPEGGEAAPPPPASWKGPRGMWDAMTPEERADWIRVDAGAKVVAARVAAAPAVAPVKPAGASKLALLGLGELKRRHGKATKKRDQVAAEVAELEAKAPELAAAEIAAGPELARRHVEAGRRPTPQAKAAVEEAKREQVAAVEAVTANRAAIDAVSRELFELDREVERFERLVAAQREAKLLGRVQSQSAANLAAFRDALALRLLHNRLSYGPEVSAVPGDLANGLGLGPGVIAARSTELRAELLAEIDREDS